MGRIPAGLAAFGLFSAVATPLGADPMQGGVPYRMSIDSRLKTWSDRSPTIAVVARADFDYRIARDGDRVVVAIDRVTMTAGIDGREVNGSEMSRSGIVVRKEGESRTLSREGGSPRLLQALDQFEVPLATITLDPEGGEVRREVKFDGGPLIEADGIGCTRIFHARFPRDKAAWDTTSLMPLVKGRVARGTLHYAKRPARRDDGRVEVDVAGKLDLVGDLGGARSRKGIYTVKGVQTYDPALGDWVAGKLTVDMDYETAQPDGNVFYGRGPVVMTLTRLDGPDADRRPPSAPPRPPTQPPGP